MIKLSLIALCVLPMAVQAQVHVRDMDATTMSEVKNYRLESRKGHDIMTITTFIDRRAALYCIQSKYGMSCLPIKDTRLKGY